MFKAPPTVNAEQIKKFYSNVKSNQNKPSIHAEFNYYRTDSLEDQLDEFISYTELQNDLADYQEEYNSTYPHWKYCSLQERKEIVSNCFDHLDFTHDEERVNAAKCLCYISLGNYGEDLKEQPARSNEKEDHFRRMKENNQLLYIMDILVVLKQSLKHACCELELSSTLSQSEAFASFCKEIDMNLTVLYMVLQFNDEEKEQIQKANLLETLFSFIVRLKEYFTNLFPLRKLMMTIQKLLCITFGELDTDDYRTIKSNMRKAYHLPPIASTTTTTTNEKNRKETMVKCTPEELYNIFYSQSLERYPTFTPTPPPAIISNPLFISSSNTTRLTKAMGLSKASKSTDLPYQTLFPSKNGGSHQQTQQQQQQQQAKNNGLAMEIRDSAFLAMLEEPFSLKEANTVWMKHLYISVATFQLLQEKRKAVFRWQHHLQDILRRDELRRQRLDTAEHVVDEAPDNGKVDDDDNDDDDDDDDDMDLNDDGAFDVKLLRNQDKKVLKGINRFYAEIVPNLQKIVVVFLKLLLSTISINNNSKESNARLKSSSAEEDKAASASTTLEEMDSVRNKEILSETVSRVILLLLKYFKLSHILKFEYFSQMLIDCGCMLLILKLIGLQEMPVLASTRSDRKGYSFTDFIQGITATGNSSTVEVVQSSNDVKTYTNKRTLRWSIHLLRILQMLTKRKSQRISLLVQYKSSAVLKKLLKVDHPTLNRYVLKNLKNQVPFMGRKWRSSNMKTISAIYAHCLTTLNDDWLSRPDNENKEEYKLEEINLRMLIRFYIGQRYLQHLLPTLDEFTGKEDCIFFKHTCSEANITEQQQDPATDSVRERRTPLLPDYVFHHTIDLDDPFIASGADHVAATVVTDLEIDFKLNYRQWLEKEVYSTDTDDDNAEGEEENNDHDRQNLENSIRNKEHSEATGWDTPIPTSAPPPPLSPEELSKEINRIYQMEIEREFTQKQQKQKEREAQQREAELSGWGEPTFSDAAASMDGWGSTPTTTSFAPKTVNGWGDESSDVPSTLAGKPSLSDDEEDADEPEPNLDPLEGIDWQNLSEEELKRRLNVVEQKTVHRYMNVSIDDEAYLKVVNPLETQLAEDDDGWFIE